MGNFQVRYDFEADSIDEVNTIMSEFVESLQQKLDDGLIAECSYEFSARHVWPSLSVDGTGGTITFYCDVDFSFGDKQSGTLVSEAAFTPANNQFSLDFHTSSVRKDLLEGEYLD